MSDSFSKSVFKNLAGASVDEILRRGSEYGSISTRISAELKTQHPDKLRDIGDSADGVVYLSEEDRRANTHIIGAPEQGKSKLLEMLIRQDVKRGQGVCLLDPSDNGDTMYRVLRWCIHQYKETGDERYKKVCLIDPHDAAQKEFGGFEKIPVIVPRHNLMDTIRILFSTKDFSETPTIQQYLPSVFYALKKAKQPLSSFVNFRNKSDAIYRLKRNEIIRALPPRDDHRIELEDLFSPGNAMLFKEFRSSIRRMTPFRHYIMRSMFQVKGGIPFNDMIRDGWIILCNLDYTGVANFGNEHQRLIGTMVIHEIFQSLSAMAANKRQGVYNLYIDEVGDYATRSLSTILLKKRKLGLRLTLAHQSLAQIEDKLVENAIYTGARTKFLFHTQDPHDAYQMIRMMYGGSISDEEVRYYLGQLPKQQALLKIAKKPTVTITLNDVPDYEVTADEMRKFKEDIYKHPWYRDARKKKDVKKEESVRPTRKRPDEGGGVGVASERKGERESTSGFKLRKVFDDKTDSPAPLRDTQGRKPRSPRKGKSKGDGGV